MSTTTATRPARTTMRAIVQNRYGTSEVLHPAQIERPDIGADEVLVQVRAAGLSRGTWHLMNGKPYGVPMPRPDRRARAAVRA